MKKVAEAVHYRTDYLNDYRHARSLWRENEADERERSAV